MGDARKHQGKEAPAKIVDLYIAEYQVLTNNIQAWLTIQASLWPLFVFYLTFVIYAWPYFNRLALTWSVGIVGQVIGIFWCVSQHEVFNNIWYQESVLRPNVKALVGDVRFWEREPLLAQQRGRWVWWEFPIPIGAVVGVGLLVFLRRLEWSAHDWIGLSFNLVFLGALFGMWLRAVTTRRESQQFAQHPMVAVPAAAGDQLVEANMREMRAIGMEPQWQRGKGSIICKNVSLGVFVQHVMWKRKDRSISYDQIIRAERGGGVFLPVDREGRIGLQRVWRPQTADQQRWSSNFPHYTINDLGRESYEIPRGFAEVGESGTETAARETREETASAVIVQSSLGFTCDNTTFSPHLTQVTYGEIDRSQVLEVTDPNEVILKRVEFFKWEEVSALQHAGKLYDGYSLAAIGMLALRCKIDFQGLER